MVKKGLPSLSKGKFYAMKTKTETEKKEKKFCSCKKVTTGAYRNHCTDGPSKSQKDKSDDDDNKKRRKRSLTDEIDLSNLVNLNRSLYENQTQPQPLPLNATSSCVSILSNNPRLQTCHTKGIIDLPKLVEDCESDFNVIFDELNLSVSFQY